MIATILAQPAAHIGKVYELTGPRSQDLQAMAAVYSAALGRPITYVDGPLEQWCDQELRRRQLPDHVFEHLLTMARLHAAHRYDRLTHDVEMIIGRPATSVRDFVARHAAFSGPSAREPVARLTMELPEGKIAAARRSAAGATSGTSPVHVRAPL